MTPLALAAEVLALDKEATAGGWTINPFVAQVDPIAGGSDLAICRMLWPTTLRSEGETLNNAVLIAHYRTSAPALARAVKEMEAEILTLCKVIKTSAPDDFIAEGLARKICQDRGIPFPTPPASKDSAG